MIRRNTSTNYLNKITVKNDNKYINSSLPSIKNYWKT